MPDSFASFATSLQSPATEAFAIAPSDTIELVQATRALNVSQSGFVRVQTVSGSTATVFVAAGITFPIRVQRVFATGTDAQGIVGLL